MEIRKGVRMSINTIKKALLGLAGLTAAGAVMWVSVARPVQANSDDTMMMHGQWSKKDPKLMLDMMKQHHGENWKEGCTKMMKELDHE